MSRLRMLVRLVVATRVLLPIAITHIRDRRRFLLVGGPRKLSIDQRRHRAERLANAFERLGTTYIKLAQFMTTRPDFIPPIYVAAMERLQDEVPPEDFRKVKAMLEDEFGRPIDAVYDDFEEEAISGASIAQVHRAVIDGEPVVLKVRRPGLEKRIEADLRALRFIVPIVLFFLKYLGQESHAESAQGITDELQKTLREETNFLREATVMEEIRQNFERDGVDEFAIVPAVHREYTTEKVITMSYEPGIKVKHVDEMKRQGHDPQDVVDKIATAYLYMAFTHDVYQADPHQGNLAVAEDGRVIIYDYGISERPDPETQEAFKDMFVGVALHNPERVVDALKDMGAVDPSMDQATLVEVSQIMIMDIAGHDIDEQDIEALERKVDETLYDYPLKFPQEIVLAMRATFGIEGLCARMAPDYDFTEKLHEFFVEQGEIDLEKVEDDIVGDGFGPRLLRGFDRLLGQVAFLGNERPLLHFLSRNPGVLRFGPLKYLDLGGPLQNGSADITEFEFDAEVEDTFDEDEMKDHIEEMSKKSGKRTAWSVLGGASLISGAITLTAGMATLSAPFFALSGISFLVVKRSFAERGGVMGPKYVATRHEMSQWEEIQEGEVESVNVDAEPGADAGEPGAEMEIGGDAAPGMDEPMGNGDPFAEYEDAYAPDAQPARADGGDPFDDS